MKVSMTESGVVTLHPESGAESYALQRRAESAIVGVPDPSRNESFYYRGSSVRVEQMQQPSKVGAE